MPSSSIWPLGWIGRIPAIIADELFGVRGTSNPPSREHVFSRWLLKELEFLDDPIALYRTLADGNIVVIVLRR